VVSTDPEVVVMSANVFRSLVGVVVIAVIGVALWIITADDAASGERSDAFVLIEYDPTGEPIPAEEQVATGTAELTRSEEEITVFTEIEGLIEGGVYTFWIVAVQGEGEFPQDIFVNDGVGVIADGDGKASATMRSKLGDRSIEGFYVEGVGDVVFSDLLDPMGAVVRVELVYHGHSDDAGDDLDAWMSDFWTGDPQWCADPLGTLGTGSVPTHPYCGGFWAATFGPPDSEVEIEGPTRAGTSTE